MVAGGRCACRGRRRPIGRGRRRAARRGCAGRGCGCRPGWRPVGGVPLMQGSSSAGLHMPGAASLAKTASMVARASGVSQPLIGVMPSMSWRPMVRPRRLARSMSVKSPSGLRQSVSLSASLASSSGRCSRPAGRVALRRGRGSRCRRNRAADAKKPRITATWPAPSSPLRCAAAVASNTGGNGSPFNARRSPRSAASWMRREASARLIRNRSATPGPVCRPTPPAPLRGKLVDQRVFDGGLLTTQLLEWFQHGQPFRCGEHVERQVQCAFEPARARRAPRRSLPGYSNACSNYRRCADNRTPLNRHLWRKPNCGSIGC